MMRRGRKTLILLDSGSWRFGRIVGPRRSESGVRVQLLERDGGKFPIFTVAEQTVGDGFAL
ncbi:Enoyl-CoA hydratase [Prescottella defluvii]|uniref:hypothetical protein n=1 Tax=Prescottella defluvii TaxID=1323361 RepID=UPI0004F3C927|nr:hypothetical protein [Prescottella defluvii]